MRLRRCGRTHGEHHDGCVVARFLQPQGFFDGVGVEFVDDTVGRGAVERLVGGIEPLLRPCVGHLLDADHDLHVGGFLLGAS